MQSDVDLRQERADLKNEIRVFNEQLLPLSGDSVEYIAISTAIIALRIRLTEITNEQIRRSNFLPKRVLSGQDHNISTQLAEVTHSIFRKKLLKAYEFGVNFPDDCSGSI